ncbi:hypothetical protein B0T18DRAFT_47805 [Schizothecium vesticola]|uniref:Zn(2)-C6 fungal-type domain-containing protein n=1 Tax=Schizothecium vesticola TaxID=314040 RepID=A0AA40FBS8_9PEZI|nr:hypothetical protein B0T18DRAFT_47805 [Schizothecium vesticola]
MPGELATARLAPTSATKAPCHPDPSPLMHSYVDFVPWNHDPFAFASSQLPNTFTAPIDAAYYPYSGALGTGNDGFPSSLQTTVPPSSLSFFPVQSFDFGDVRCETPSALGVTPDSLPYHPAPEPEAPGISAGASLDLSLDLYGAWGNGQRQDSGDQLHPHRDPFFPTEDFTHDALGPAKSGQEANVCSMSSYMSATSENIQSRSQAQPDHRHYTDSTPQPRKASFLHHGERAVGGDASSPESGHSGPPTVAPQKAVQTNAWGSDPEKPSSSDAHSEGKCITAHQLRDSGNSGSKLGEALASCKRPSETPTSIVQTPARGRKRGRLADDVRKNVHATRLIGACIRCHIQRARCEPNEADQDNPLAACKTCLKVDKTSKKTIHNIPCLRFKLTSVVIYRAGGLQLTERFTHTEVKDVASFGPTIEMKMSQGLCREPVTLYIREFVPRPGDVLHRSFASSGGAKSIMEIPPFCLQDVEKTAKDFTRYILANSLDGLEEAGRGEPEIVRRTFAMIRRHCQELPTGPTPRTSKVYNSQKELITVAVNLWFAIRHGIGTATLCSQLPTKEQCPAPSAHVSQSVPRMIVAQFDSIRHERIYKEFCPKVLRTYESHLTSGNRDTWFTLYLVTFLFLTLVGSASRDRLRHARQVAGDEAQETRYGPVDHPTTCFVEELQNSGVVLLLYWTYFKRADLMKVDWDNPKRSPLVAPYQVEFMKWTVQELEKSRDGIPPTPPDGCWEDNLFWISRMFMSAPSGGDAWSPPERFDRRKPSVGRE